MSNDSSGAPVFCAEDTSSHGWVVPTPPADQLPGVPSSRKAESSPSRPPQSHAALSPYRLRQPRAQSLR